MSAVTQQHNVVSQEEWLEARRALLVEEKRLTRELDGLHARRRELPWVRVDKDYSFEGPDGPLKLSDLFDGNSQLIVYHFMYAPGAKEGCPGCSFLADHIDGPRLHLQHHDVTLAVVSRAPFAEFQPFKQRMGWKFPWYSSFGSDFNFDYNVSWTEESLAADGTPSYNFAEVPNKKPGEAPGTSVFIKDADGTIYHTYSSYARGGDILLGAHNYLDLTPKGRNESSTMEWLKHHDKYEGAQSGASGGE
jgi:predicted dithiol-disulfide oxidoreductase (DUF899 family)